MPSSPEPAADKGPCGRSSLVASSPSVAPRARLPGGVSGGVMDRAEIKPPVVWFLKSLGDKTACQGFESCLRGPRLVLCSDTCA